jgi:hypothetical protein
MIIWTVHRNDDRYDTIKFVNDHLRFSIGDSLVKRLEAASAVLI